MLYSLPSREATAWRLPHRHTRQAYHLPLSPDDTARILTGRLLRWHSPRRALPPAFLSAAPPRHRLSPRRMESAAVPAIPSSGNPCPRGAVARRTPCACRRNIRRAELPPASIRQTSLAVFPRQDQSTDASECALDVSYRASRKGIDNLHKPPGGAAHMANGMSLCIS